LEDPDFYIFILIKSPKNSILRELIKKYQKGERAFEYTEVKRIPIIESLENSKFEESKINLI